MTIRHYHQIREHDELHDNDDHSDSDNDGDDFLTDLSKITNLHVKKQLTYEFCQRRFGRVRGVLEC